MSMMDWAWNGLSGLCALALFSTEGAHASPQRKAGDDLVWVIPGTDGIEYRMRRIPAGTFEMGSPADEKDRDPDEGPVRTVTISRPFYLGVYPVTQAQWEAVMGENSSWFKGDPERPVEQVSWADAQRFIEKLNAAGDGHFRLPTEAEWEYACRAGTTTRFFWGNDIEEREVGEYAWYMDNTERASQPVGWKQPNPWGLHDMIGNVYTWCQDWYAPEYDTNSRVDPSGPDSGLYRVIRGGSWHHWPRHLRSANRFRYAPTARFFHVGVRLAMDAP